MYTQREREKHRGVMHSLASHTSSVQRPLLCTKRRAMTAPVVTCTLQAQQAAVRLCQRLTGRHVASEYYAQTHTCRRAESALINMLARSSRLACTLLQLSRRRLPCSLLNVAGQPSPHVGFPCTLLMSWVQTCHLHDATASAATSMLQSVNVRDVPSSSAGDKHPSPASSLFARLGARLPIVQAPMASSGGVDLAVAAIVAGGVGSLPCALISASEVRTQFAAVEAATFPGAPLVLNFFCHRMPSEAESDDTAWRATLEPFYAAEGLPPAAEKHRHAPPPPPRRPFDEESARVVEELRPKAVSFHFGLPPPELLARVRAAGCLVLATATTVREAQWLAAQGVDAIVAQGFEAGGHAGHFLAGHRPVGLFALVPQVVDAMRQHQLKHGGPLRPVIAAGGIADSRGAAAAIVLGASGIQVGTAYLPTRESIASPIHRGALLSSNSDTAPDTTFTTLFSGGQARGIRNRLMNELGPCHPAAPPFPAASAAVAPLRAKAEADGGRNDYSPLWAGQAVPLTAAAVHTAAAALPPVEIDAGSVTRVLGEAARHALAGRAP